jgi:hypothetical protein
MPVNSTHPEYEENLPAWLRARDAIAGEDAIKCGGEKYLPRLEAQTDEEYAAYRDRASFFNATARTADGYLGLLFRRPPFIKVAGSEERRAKSGGQRAADGNGHLTPTQWLPKPATSQLPQEGRSLREVWSPERRGSDGAQRTARPTTSAERSREALSGLWRAMTQFVNDADMLGTSMANYARNVAREVIGVGRVGVNRRERKERREKTANKRGLTRNITTEAQRHGEINN